MSLTPSSMLALGTTAPDFTLSDVVSNRPVGLNDFEGKKALMVMFICAHCPYVVHVGRELARIGKDYADKSLGILAISANDIENYPEDAPDKLKAIALKFGFSFPFCFDESQAVAKAYTAACTPDFFLFDENRGLVYRGQLDDSRPGRGTPNGRDLRLAIDAVLSGTPVDSDQKPSTGCNIKWKSR